MVEGWTESRYWSFIRSILRRGFTRYPNKFKVLKESRHGRNKYKCNGCKKTYGKKDIAVDHIDPCGKLTSYSDLPDFVSKLFCGVEGLQVLCTNCHYVKSMRERGMTDEQIVVAWFKRMKAGEQKKHLRAMNVEPGKNQEERIKQYLDNI